MRSWPSTPGTARPTSAWSRRTASCWAAPGGPFRPHLVGAAAAVASIAPAVAGALSRAGSVEVRHVAACLANVDLPVEHAAIEEAIAAAGWAPSHEVVNDTFALLRAGLDSTRGRRGGLRRRDQLHRRAGGRHDGAVRGRRAHLRRLGRRRPPLAGGDVVGGASRGRPWPRHGAAHRAPPALRAVVDGRADRGRAPRRAPRGALHGADPAAVLGGRGRRPDRPRDRAAPGRGGRRAGRDRHPPTRRAVGARSTWCSAAAC